jgi:hypothetical protein
MNGHMQLFSLIVPKDDLIFNFILRRLWKEVIVANSKPGFTAFIKCTLFTFYLEQNTTESIIVTYCNVIFTT